jgi:HAD superfamily hydrolase (TIGR01509 family)
MLLSCKSHLLFDFDGTLANSAALHDRAFRAAITRHMPGMLGKYNYDTVTGRTTREAFIDLGVCDPKVLEMVTFVKQRRYIDEIKKRRLDLLPGARHLLATLAEKGFNLFLVTSGSKGSIMTALRSTRIARFFRGVVTADDVSRGKPSPEPYVYCLNRFGLDARASIAIEDAANGVIAAKKAGLPVVGVNNGKISSFVDAFFPSLVELEKWVGTVSEKGESS